MDDIYITLAGPGMNVVLCLVLALIGTIGDFDPNTQEVIIVFLARGIFLNAGLAVFNLIPVPPLDGSRLALRLGLYSEELFLTIARWGFVILIVLINLPGFGRFIHWAMSPLLEGSAMVWPFFERFL